MNRQFMKAVICEIWIADLKFTDGVRESLRANCQFTWTDSALNEN